MSSINLINCIKDFYKLEKNKFKLKVENIENCSLQNIKNIFKELYKRFIIPFIYQFWL